LLVEVVVVSVHTSRLLSTLTKLWSISSPRLSEHLRV
jgi:hypothetical protein